MNDIWNKNILMFVIFVADKMYKKHAYTNKQVNSEIKKHFHLIYTKLVISYVQVKKTDRNSNIIINLNFFVM